jgi:pyruvate,water dikinase
MIKTFKQLTMKDTPIAGGKGASLGEMINQKIPVPPGYVILTEAFENFLDEADLRVEVNSEINDVGKDKMHTVEHASERIQDMIHRAEMPKQIGEEIQKEFKKLGAKFVAVRSSATAEDSHSAAWAGQLDSFLNTTEETLLQKVQECWASLFTPRAIFYRLEQGLKKSNVSVAVVVQKMVESEVSGIAFTVHPVTQDKNQLIIEAGFGLGEAIVSGSITPDSYVVSKKDWQIIDINIAEQEKKIVRKGQEGNEWVSVGSEDQDVQKLTGQQIIELSKIVVGIENHYKFPCDIEWALEGGKFYITQSRPITTL